jgi:hypothetical protein
VNHSVKSDKIPQLKVPDVLREHRDLMVDSTEIAPFVVADIAAGYDVPDIL